MSIEKDYEKKHFKRLLQMQKDLDNMMQNSYDQFAQELARYDIKNPKKFVWKKYPRLEGRIDKEITSLNKNLSGFVQAQQVKGWNLANQKNDELTNQYIRNIALSEGIKTSFFSQNTQALNAFINRTENGWNLSDRVWNITKQTKPQLKTLIGHGIATGRSSSDISRDVRHILKEPNRRFRHVNKNGKYQWSKPAKHYLSKHNMKGQYLSSYQNALRLTATETNMAYRMSNYHRRQQLPFVIGVIVKLSGSHPEYDICDHMAGEYPKGFIFTGWHPRCICQDHSKLLPKEEFKQYLKTGKIHSKHFTKSVPTRAQNYLNSNKHRFDNYKSQPYFIRDNFKHKAKNQYASKDHVSSVKVSNVEKANDPFAGGGPIHYPRSFDKAKRELSSEKTFLQVRDEGRHYSNSDEFFNQFGGREAARKTLQEKFDNSDVYMAIDGSKLTNKVIKGDRKFKNSLETGQGTFKTIGNDRAVKEKKMFGIDADTDAPDSFPKYGFLSSSKEMSYENIVGWGYGDTYVKFRKDKVWNRTTATLGDSYDGNIIRTGESGELMASRVAPPTRVANADENFLMSLSKREPGMLQKSVGRNFKKSTIDEFADSASRGSYVEAQVYGEVTLDDVGEIYTSSIKNANKMKTALKKVGSNVKVKPCKYDERLKYVWEGSEYDGPASKYLASLKPKDVDMLGDGYIRSLEKRWVETAKGWANNSAKGINGLPETLRDVVRRKMEHQSLSTTELRDWFKDFYTRMAQKQEGGLPKSWYEDYRKSFGGFTEDVYNKDLLESYE